MSEGPTRVFAFDRYFARHATEARAGAGVTLAPRRVPVMWNVRGRPDDTRFLSEAADAFGVSLPVVPNTAAAQSGARALWLGPDEWLVVSDSEITQKRIAGATLTDVSHGRGVVRLSGTHVRDALAKGCPLDLDPRTFPVNTCAQTAIARINVILDHVQSDVFDLYCSRSYAGSLWHWLTEAAAEYAFNAAFSCAEKPVNDTEGNQGFPP